ncbi:MAG: T9SS type A sorting domain-containing protein [Bacteroidota bacterium]
MPPSEGEITWQSVAYSPLEAMRVKELAQALSLLFILSITLLSSVSAQNISAKTFYQFDEASSQMIPDRSFRWYYDALDQDTLSEAWIWEQEANSFQLSFRRSTSYHSSGERLVESTSFWESAGVRISQKEWEYDNAGRNIVFSEYRQNANETTLSPFSRWEKVFDPQGCLIRQTFYQADQPNRRDLYLYGADCRLDTFFSDQYEAGNWQASERSIYQYQDSLETQINSLWQDNSWSFRRRLNLTFDKQGRLLQWRATYPDSSQYRIEYAFDANSNQTYYAESQLATGDSLWEYFLAEQKTYYTDNLLFTLSNFFDYDKEQQRFLGRNDRERLYNTDGRISSERSKLINLSLADTLVSETLFVFEYESYCDGLLWWEETFREAAGKEDRLSRIEYSYEEVASCEEEAIGLTIAPNPVSDELSFYSEDLMRANTVLSIYDIQQRLVYSGSVPYRTSHYIVPVQSLTPGYYYLRVGAAERSLYAKFVKLP